MRSISMNVATVYCVVIAISWLLILVTGYPVEDVQLDPLMEVLESGEQMKIPVETGSKENNHVLVRNKRTIGFLRQLFPGLSQIIDRKIQQLTRVIFRVVGRLILRGGGGGTTVGGGSDTSGSSSSDKGRRISITLPTYPPSTDDEEDEDSATVITSSESSSSSEKPSTDNIESSTSSIVTDAAVTSSEQPVTTTIRADVPDVDSNQVATDGQDTAGIVKRFNRDVSDVLDETTETPPADIQNIDVSTEDTTEKKGRSGFLWRLGRDMRNRRNPLRMSGQNGGPGNFIFDILRLVAGSGANPEKDEDSNSTRDVRDDEAVIGIDNTSDPASPTPSTDDNYNAGIPGPLTRLFILANRGISNLIQDLILRLAQTSERIVNFKARLITSII